MERDKTLCGFAQWLSFFLGWSYFLAWSLSFYPQPIVNWRRKSTEGLSVDFSVANLVGFSSYTIYTSALLYSKTIRKQYAERHVKNPEPAVRFNDLVYCLHGITLILIVFTQFWPWLWGFKVGTSQRASWRMLAICAAGLTGVALVFLFATTGRGRSSSGSTQWQYLDVIYAFGDFKLVLTILKYIPQVWLNFKRKSTTGWAIEAILLDFVGGCLSILQLIIDVALSPDWTGIVGNPAKLALGNLTILFDMVFLAQHFVLYREDSSSNAKASREADGEHNPLLGGREGDS